LAYSRGAAVGAPRLAAAGHRARRGFAQGSHLVAARDATVPGALDGDAGKLVTSPAWRPAWYRLRAGFRRDWAGYLAIAL